VPRKANTVVVQGRRLQVSLYDRASSGLLAMVITVGTVVSLLVMIWLSNRVFKSIKAVPVEMIEVAEDGEGGGDGRATGGSQLDTPSDEPVVGKDKETTDVEETLSVLDNAVATRAAELDDPTLVEPTRHGSFGTGGGLYGGFGDGRGLGHGPGKPGLPRHWEITFPKGNTLEAYARQLDFFGIELGILMPNNTIVYAFHLAKPKPDTRVITEPYKNEKRYYLSWRDGELKKADRALLARAGIQVEDQVVLQFLPRETEEKLYLLEGSFRGLDRKKIGTTRFGIQPVGDGFAFYVLEQTQRTPRR
jgi:hypothetical protein